MIQVHGDATGLYGRAAIKGGAVFPNSEANVAYYDQGLTPKEILFDTKPKPSEAALTLAQKLVQAAK